MSFIPNAGNPDASRYKISRRGRTQALDDQRILAALPKDVPDRTWLEIFFKEESDLLIFDIREEIVEEALKMVHERYLERQNALFAAHCAAQAWLKLVDWAFYRHDPGEDPNASPACFIPKRAESWIPDALPDPSPKDTWAKQDLEVIEDVSEVQLQKWPSSSSIEEPVVDEIPREYWFPGKINFPRTGSSEELLNSESYYDSSELESRPSVAIGADSEVLQKVTDYSTEDLSLKESGRSAPKLTTPVDPSVLGAGDAGDAGESGGTGDVPGARAKQKRVKSKSFSKASVSGRSKLQLPPLERDSRSRISIISDCRLRNLRLETQYEISSEKVESLLDEPVKRK